MILEQAAKSGQPAPERIQNAPSLLPGLELYYIAFMDLMASRMVGFGLGPIWWSTVQSYCESSELDELQTEAMHYHIRAMDTAYMKLNEKKVTPVGNFGSVQQKHTKAGKPS